jgi:hypothetical protein
VPSPPHGAAGDTSELVEYVRSRLPIRARLLGEERLQDLVMLTVAAWPIDGLLAADAGSSEEIVQLELTKIEVSRMYAALHGDPKSGSILLAIVLPAMLSALIQVVLKWWLEKRSRRTKMAIWQHLMKGGGA